jgi:ketosteroid isomerase-like protein
MKRVFITTLVLTALVFAGRQHINGQTGDNSKLEGEIGKVLRDYYDAFSRRDFAATSTLYADDGFVYEGGYSTTKQVKAEVRAYLQTPAAAGSKDSYEIEDLKILPVSADAAMANYTVVTKSEQNGKTTIRRDRSTNVFARREGHWLIVADHTSPLPTPVTPTVRGMPAGWIRTPSYSSNGYSMTVDTIVKHGGLASAAIKLTCGGENEFGSLGQTIVADDYIGKRVRFTGWLKTENADAAVLWMRVDGNRRTLGFDNMLNRAVKGTTDWKQFEVVLDIPTGAVNVVIGTFLSGKGQMWADDLKLEIVGNDVPSTNQLSSEQMRLDNPNRNPKKSDIKQPANLGFENGMIL